MEKSYALLDDKVNYYKVLDIIEHCMYSKTSAGTKPIFFISYARKRPYEADFIENLLRRRKCEVFRDDSDFGAGHQVQNEIKEHLYRANVFIAVWCQEYACSPWCYDEFDDALERQKNNDMDIWLICVDDTRIVPKGARELLAHTAKTRAEVEGTILKLLYARNS